VELAEKNKDSELAEYYDTSAAAYAEAGDFDKSGAHEIKGMRTVQTRDAGDAQIECEQLIEAYKRNKPIINGKHASWAQMTSRRAMDHADIPA